MQGEREAWSALIALHGRKVVVAMLAKGAPMPQAQELAHEAWVRLMDQQRLGRLRELVLPGLAVAQASLLLLEERRRHSNLARTHGSELELLGLSHDGPSAEAHTLGREELRRTLDAVERCTPAEKRVFNMLYGNDPAQSHGEAAERLGLSVQRVRQLLFEVRRKLKRALEGEPP